MKTKTMILPMVCCIPLMSSCATDQPMEKPAWNIKPVYKVNNVAVDNPNALYQMGRYYQGQRRYEQAAESYRKTLAADASFVEAHNGLGVIYSMQGQYDAAITEFKMAISLAPKSGHLYNNLGHTLYLQGAYAEAVSALEQGVSLAPGNPRTLNNLGLAYAKAGKAGKSRQIFVEAAKPAREDISVAPLKAPAPSDAIQAIPARPSAEQVVVTQASPEPAPTNPASTKPAPTVRALEPPVQTLALPKDRGVIIEAPVAPTVVSNTEIPVGAVRVAMNISEPNVSEANVSEPVKPSELVSANASASNAPVVSKATAVVLPAMVEVQPAPTVSADSPSLRMALIPQMLAHLEVSNGNGTSGMARKVATFLQEIGYERARLTNRKPYTVQTTQIQYRPGHQADAEYLRDSLPTNLPMYAALVQSSSLRDDINLRVVLGKDIVRHTAYFNGNTTQKLVVTRNDIDS